MKSECWYFKVINFCIPEIDSEKYWFENWVGSVRDERQTDTGRGFGSSRWWRDPVRELVLQLPNETQNDLKNGKKLLILICSIITFYFSFIHGLAIEF